MQLISNWKDALKMSSVQAGGAIAVSDGDALTKALEAMDASAQARLAKIASQVLAPQGDELVLRILPGHRRHIGGGRRAQLDVIGSSVGVDDEIGADVGPRRLDQNMHPARGAAAAHGIADDPAHRKYWHGTDRLLVNALFFGNLLNPAKPRG